MRFGKYYIVFLLSGIIFSCEKENEIPNSGPTSVSGQIRDILTEKPIPFAKVFLTGSGFTPGSQGIYLTEIADENGNYSIDFNAEEKLYYSVEAESEYYFKNYQGKSIYKGYENKGAVIRLNPKGYVQFNIINSEPKEIANRINVANQIHLNYIVHDTIVFIEALGNKNLQFSWWISEKQYSDQIHVPALDTINYSIYY